LASYSLSSSAAAQDAGLHGAVAGTPSVQSEARPGNVLLIVLDDVGIDGVGVYGTGFSPPTPNIDALATNGMRFLNAWSNPVCSPTRASIQTGRFAFQTGVGEVIKGAQLGTPGLRPEEITLAEAVRITSNGAFATGCFGKWHLTPGDPFGPNDQGFDEYAGLLNNLTGAQSYDSYEWTENGFTAPETQYLTSKTVDRALGWISTRSRPWLAVVPFHLAHTPYHEPPASLHTRDLTSAGTPGANPRPYWEAMVEAMDTEIGRLLQGVGPALARTTVIVVGDNGTQFRVTPYDPEHAKGSLYQAGVNVPLIFSGYRVKRGISPALVNVTDLFATIVELMGGHVAQVEPAGRVVNSESLLPLLSHPNQAVRAFNFSQRFFPLGFDASGVSHGLPMQPPAPSGCQTDLGFAGPGQATIRMCGLPLAAGIRGYVTVENGPPNAAFTLFQAPVASPTPLLGGTFVADVQDPLGTWTLDSHGYARVQVVTGQDLGPIDYVVQAIVDDSSQPFGFAITNALALHVLPYNEIAVQDAAGFKAIFSVNAGDVPGAVQLFDLNSDPQEATNLFPPLPGSVEELHYIGLRDYRDQVLANP